MITRNNEKYMNETNKQTKEKEPKFCVEPKTKTIHVPKTGEDDIK